MYATLAVVLAADVESIFTRIGYAAIALASIGALAFGAWLSLKTFRETRDVGKAVVNVLAAVLLAALILSMVLLVPIAQNTVTKYSNDPTPAATTVAGQAGGTGG